MSADMLRLIGWTALGAVLLGSLPGCKNITRFDVSQDIPEQEIRGNVLAGVLGDFFEIPIEVDIEAETEKRNTGPAKRVELKALSLHITETHESEGDRDTFDFLDSAEVFIESRESESELEPRKVAEITDVPNDARRIEFDTFRDVNLKPYIEEGARMTARGEGRAPEDDVSYAGEAVFFVKVL